MWFWFFKMNSRHRRGPRVGKWETWVWFSTFPGAARLSCGNVEISRGWRDFQGAVGRVENLGLVFHSFHGPGISTALFSSGLDSQSNCSLGPPRLRQQRQLGFLHLLCRLRIAPTHGLLLQQRRANPRFQVLLPLRQRDQILVRRAIILDRVTALAFAPRQDSDRGETAGPVIVQIWVQMRRVELLKVFGMLGRDRSVADVLSYDGAVLAFH